MCFSLGTATCLWKSSPRSWGHNSATATSVHMQPESSSHPFSVQRRLEMLSCVSATSGDCWSRNVRSVAGGFRSPGSATNSHHVFQIACCSKAAGAYLAAGGLVVEQGADVLEAEADAARDCLAGVACRTNEGLQIRAIIQEDYYFLDCAAAWVSALEQPASKCRDARQRRGAAVLSRCGRQAGTAGQSHRSRTGSWGCPPPCRRAQYASACQQRHAGPWPEHCAGMLMAELHRFTRLP